MKLEQIELPVNNQLLLEYWSSSKKIQTFYQYEYNDESFVTRYNYLKQKHYDYQKLSNIIRSFMEPFGISESVNENLLHLEKGAVAIVGGQQAGILTGPLYSVHKAISVILLAREQSEKLGDKVVPIFWIAGEDHDLEEINHTYTIVNGLPKKRMYEERTHKKTMASTTIIQKNELKHLIQTIFHDYGETEYTHQLLTSILEQVDRSDTFTQFFARLMNDLFKNEGLLMIDAAYEPFRRFESSFFAQIIEHNEQIAKVVVEQERLFSEAGFGTPISATPENANLFYVEDGERFLLERKNGQFENSNGLIKLSKEHLLDIAATTPEKLSNNVVTRPLMQEMTIPVLAFVGGAGELAYWGTLKDAFHTLNLQMPILVPRMNITLITRKVEQLLSDYHLTITEIMNGTGNSKKEEFIKSVQDTEALDQISELKNYLNEQYQELKEHLSSKEIKLDAVIEKNKQYHKLQLDYLTKKIQQQVLIKHEKTIRHFNTMISEVYPNDSLQERVYNPYYYINSYGPTLISDLCSLQMTITNKHYIVRL